MSENSIIIALANAKGGVGKTTSAIELAASLANHGKRVLLIDLDQQRNLSKYVGADLSSPTIYEALHANATIQSTIQHLSICDVITSSASLSKADREFVDATDIFLLADLIDFIRSDYDYILIDNNPGRNVLLTMAYVAADYVIIPTECDSGSLDGIMAINRDIVKLRDGKRPSSHARVMGIILTKFEKTVMHSVAKEELQEVAASLGGDPFIMEVRKAIIVSECKEVKQSLQSYAPNCPPAKNYRKIAEEIERRTN